MNIKDFFKKMSISIRICNSVLAASLTPEACALLSISIKSNLFVYHILSENFQWNTCLLDIILLSLHCLCLKKAAQHPKESIHFPFRVSTAVKNPLAFLILLMRLFRLSLLDNAQCPSPFLLAKGRRHNLRNHESRALVCKRSSTSSPPGHSKQDRVIKHKWRADEESWSWMFQFQYFVRGQLKVANISQGTECEMYCQELSSIKGQYAIFPHLICRQTSTLTNLSTKPVKLLEQHGYLCWHCLQLSEKGLHNCLNPLLDKG